MAIVAFAPSTLYLQYQSPATFQQRGKFEALGSGEAQALGNALSQMTAILKGSDGTRPLCP
jgi:hypothetical protein